MKFGHFFAFEAQILARRAELDAEEADYSRLIEEASDAAAMRGRDRDRMALLRGADNC